MISHLAVSFLSMCVDEFYFLGDENCFGAYLIRAPWMFFSHGGLSDDVYKARLAQNHNIYKDDPLGADGRPPGSGTGAVGGDKKGAAAGDKKDKDSNAKDSGTINANSNSRKEKDQHNKENKHQAAGGGTSGGGQGGGDIDIEAHLSKENGVAPYLLRFQDTLHQFWVWEQKLKEIKDKSKEK